MSIYGNYNDVPDKLRKEAEDISLKFVRNGDGTATVKWNIPSPVPGCSKDELEYDGIVVTLSDKPANYITSSPQDGEYYDGDATADPDLHSGDSINTARVIGAFYHDKTTNSFTVTDVKDKTPYYVSAYAVDQVGRYHREGVHAYSLDTGNAEPNIHDERPATQDIEIDTPQGIRTKEKTGLKRGERYNVRFEINDECYDINGIVGSNVLTYEDLVKTLNRRLATVQKPFRGPQYPNQGKFMVIVDDEIVNMWDGTQNVEQTPSIFLDTDPTNPILDTYWYDPSTETLRNRETGGWATVAYLIEFPTDPSNPDAGVIWFDGTDAWEWDGQIWCKKPTLVQTRNPLLPPELDDRTFWFNSSEDSGLVFQRNTDLRKWEEVNPIVYFKDPNNIIDGDYWYNQTNEKVFIRSSGSWSELNNIRYEERNDDGELDNPVANHYWFIPSEQILFQRNATNTAWIEREVALAFEDPTNRESCGLWWNTSPSIDDLFIWDSLNTQWTGSTAFHQQENDPADPASLEKGTLWYNPDDKTIQRITGLQCSEVNFIDIVFEPTSLPAGVVWHDTTNDKWYVWNGSSFSEITPIISENDPFLVNNGTFWYDTANDKLYKRESNQWSELTFTTDSLAPEVGFEYFDSVNEKLLEWNGEKWIDGTPIATAELMFNKEVCVKQPSDVNTDLFSPFDDVEQFGRDIIRFKTGKVGCDASIEIDRSGISKLFTELQHPVVWYDPASGRSAFPTGPVYEQIGPGDDGSPDEWRELHQSIRVSLGHPSVQVELTKEEIDECIKNALLMVRKYSSYCYERVFFFLDVFPNQQKYFLTGKCVGFNKIVDIQACYRMRTGFLGATHGVFGGYDIYGYAALQQLYATGTFDTLSYHLVSSYIEDLQYLFADQLVYTWYEDRRSLHFHQIFYGQERILVDAEIEKEHQKILKHRELAYWIKKWAIAEAKMILSQTRGKYQTLPGPNGQVTLNSQELITQSENEKAELLELIKDRSFQDINVGVKSQFWIG